MQWNSGTVTVEHCGGKVEHWWNSKTVMVEQCGGTVEHRWWNSVMKQWNSNGGTVWGHSGTVRWNSVVEQCGGKVEQSWWNSVVEQ